MPDHQHETHQVVRNMRDEFREATVEISVKLPRAHEYVRHCITIGDSLAEYFCPLPRDREIMADSAEEWAQINRKAPR